jgi:PAP2 superfamily
VLTVSLWDVAPAQAQQPNEAARQSSAQDASSNQEKSRAETAIQAPARQEAARSLGENFPGDRQEIWLFSTKLSERERWIPPVVGLGTAAGFIEGDAALQPNVRRTDMLQSPASATFDTTMLPPTTFERNARDEDLAEQDATGSSPPPQNQVQPSEQRGLVMRSARRTLEDQKELYRAPFKRSNFKWDALVLGGTAALLVEDRDIETHISHANYSYYANTSDIAIASLGTTLGAVWIWGIKGDHPQAKELGSLELETLVDTFLIYTPMQLLAARQRPDVGNGNGDFWKNHSVNTSFPGGHAMFTFAMATVVSHEYKQKWVQALAYGVASTVTVSRFLARDHWSSDMFIGSALGIGIGAHVFHAHCNPDLSDSCKHHTRWIF